MRNQAKSLELTGRSGQARNALSSDGGVEGRGQKMREDGKNSRRNLESLFHSSSTRKVCTPLRTVNCLTVDHFMITIIIYNVFNFNKEKSK